MAKEELLQELEPRTYRDRMRRMVELGRAALSAAAARALVAALERGGPYERVLALQSCYGSGDRAHIARASADSSRDVRALALALAPRFCDDDQLRAIFARLPLAPRRELCKRLWRHGRQQLVQGLVAGALEHGDHTSRPLLDFADVHSVERHLAAWLREARGADAIRMALRHPGLLVRALLDRAREAGPNGQPLELVNEILPELALRHPDRALELVRGLAGVVPLEQLELRELTRLRAADVVRLGLETGEEISPNFHPRRPPRLTVQELVALSAQHNLWDLHLAIKQLPPAQRVELFERLYADRGGTDDARLDRAELLKYLPEERRAHEARQIIADAAAAGKEHWGYGAVELLPWEEAFAALRPSLHSSDGEQRAQALSTAIDTAAYRREQLGDVLDVLIGHRNEPSHIRASMLHRLSHLPAHIWQDQHLPQLGELLEVAMGDVLRSHSTMQALERLLLKLLQTHPAWAAGWLARALRERGHMVCAFPRDRLATAPIQHVAGPLLELLHGWERQGREDEIVAVATMLDRQLARFDGLLELLEHLAHASASPAIARQALALLARWAPRRLDALVPTLLAKDRSWITEERISQHLLQRRQDLLPPFLGAGPYQGRLSAGRSSFILPLHGAPYRLTVAQQEQLAATLLSAISDREQDQASVAGAVAQLAQLAFIDPGRLLGLIDDARSLVRDTALRMLSHLDPAVALPALTAALHDESARAAAVALRGLARALTPQEALVLLRQLPAGRLAVAKERLRLLGQLGTDEAYAELLAMADQPLHPDVHIALLRGLHPYLERESAWPIVERAARSDVPSVTIALKHLPLDTLSPAARARALAALARALGHPEVRVRQALLEQLARQAPEDEQGLLLPSLISILEHEDEQTWQKGIVPILRIYASQAAALAEVVGRLRSRPPRLQAIVVELRRELRRNRQRMLRAGATILGAMDAEPYTAELRARLAVTLLAGGSEVRPGQRREHAPLAQPADWPAPPSLPTADALADIFSAMAARGELHAGALMEALQGFAQGEAHAEHVARLERFEQRLSASPNPGLRRLALAALLAQIQNKWRGAIGGWSEERLARLRTYRADPDLMVAAAARLSGPSA